MKPVDIALFALMLSAAAGGAATDKTLVAWVALSDKSVRAGSVLTIQKGDQFDGIVFAERDPGKWMAGSDFFRRTQGDRSGTPVEVADAGTLVQMAVVYEGGGIRIHRNGELHASYAAANIDLLGGSEGIAVFGLRHVGGDGSIAGTIEDARIYGRALTADELRGLKPDVASGIEPYAWWDFEGDRVVDKVGRFPHARLEGGAKLEAGRLVLGRGAVVVAAATKEAAAVSLRPGRPVFTGPYVPETPPWPEEPPADWMTYHLVHPGPGEAMPGDPNPAWFWQGRYHMHYIYRNQTGFVFAHVSSTDMVHWQWHPTVLAPPTTGHGMFSGTGFFTKEGRPVMIYHGEGSGRNHLAYGLDDRLEKWTKPEPVIPRDADGTEPEMRHWDPDCWLNGDTYYAISGGKSPHLMKSGDLKSWLHLGLLLHDDHPADLGVSRDEDISCANMFRIGNKWMLLCISHQLGCRYYLGDFKDEKYLPEFHAMMSWNGNHFFAPESIATPDGRRVMWAWLLGLPIHPTGVQSLPRELELPADGVLRIRPLRELSGLRCDERQEAGVVVKAGGRHQLKGVAGDAYELELHVASPSAREFGIDVLCDGKGGRGLRVAVDRENKVLRVGRVSAPFELKDGEELILRVFVDKNLVEVFANDRQAAVSAVEDWAPGNTGACLFSEGGEVMVRKATTWRMNTTYDGPQVFGASAEGK